jgi:hypothetical protein
MEWINDRKKVFGLTVATGAIGATLSFVYLFFGEKLSTVGAFGFVFLGISWVFYCVLEGIKREQLVKKEAAKIAPYKIDAMDSSCEAASAICTDFLPNVDGEGLHRCRDGGTCESQGNRQLCDTYDSDIDD